MAKQLSTAFQRVQSSFNKSGFMKHLGVKLHSVEEGSCVVRLPYSKEVTQQQGSFHGGAIGTIADVAAGWAGLSVAPEGHEVVSVEFKLNILSACSDGELVAKGSVIRNGRRVIVTKADVTHISETGKEKLCAVMQQTLVPVEKSY